MSVEFSGKSRGVDAEHLNPTTYMMGLDQQMILLTEDHTLPFRFLLILSSPGVFISRRQGAPVGRFLDGGNGLARFLFKFGLGFRWKWFRFCLLLKPFIAFLFRV